VEILNVRREMVVAAVVAANVVRRQPRRKLPPDLGFV
jgi:hypothetical protein